MGLFFFISTSSDAQNLSKKNSPKKEQTLWEKTDLFEQKVFIENKGQFDKQNKSYNGQIQYAVINNGVQIYFTTKGLTYRHDESHQLSKEEWEKRERGGGEKENEEAENQETVSHYVCMDWKGANPDVRISAENAVTYYFTYPDPRDLTGKSTIKAIAYKKIVYKNIYPNIDVEYTFPENKPGLKYSIIVHPNADLSSIKMNYSGETKSTIDVDGNIRITTSFGDIIDHAPLSFYESGTEIKSAFELKNNIVSFKIDPSYDLNKILIIDPWTTNPAFPSFNSAYDVDNDYQGNVYVYGGSEPFQEIKFNSSGVIQWVFTHSLTSPFWFGNFYGSFAVDPITQSSYIVQGVGSPNKVAKLNASGSIAAFFMGGTPNLEEMWRIAINKCDNKVIIAGGNPSTSYQVCILDTSLNTLTPINILSTTEVNNDFTLLALDNFNNCYMATAKSTGGGTFNNIMVKCPASTLLPLTFSVPDNHTFVELLSVNYINNQIQGSNGFNGMAVNDNFLYTYDGAVLKKWDKNNGSLLASVVVTNKKFTWGGLDVDDCDNIYVGKNGSIAHYDVNLNLVSTIPTSSTVYDLKLGLNNLMYVCGKGFVSEIKLGYTSCSAINISATPANCAPTGTATVAVTGLVGPVTYLWAPSGQSTATATNLAAGTYTVSVNYGSCIRKTLVDTVVVTNLTGMTLSSTQQNIKCKGANTGTATASATGAGGPFNYSWNTTPTQSTANISNLPAGTYICSITNASGCEDKITVTITEPAAITPTATKTNVTCNGSADGTATITAAGGTPGFTYTWNTVPVQLTANASNLATGSYVCTITDANACSATASVTITDPPLLVLNTSSSPSSCGASNGSATVSASGGTGSFTYAWNSTPIQNSSTASNLSGGQYIVTVTDAGNCVKTATASLVNTGGTTVTASTLINASCNGSSDGSATATVSTGTPNYTYSWSNNNTGTTATGLVKGIYTVTLTDGNNCQSISTTTITEPPVIIVSTTPTPASCGQANGSASAIASGGSGSFSYSWSTSATGQTISAVGANSYIVTVTDAAGCTNTAIALINSNPSPTINSFIGNNLSCNGNSSGSANVAVSGGSGNLTYSWSNPLLTGATASGLTAGTYIVSVTDAAGCTAISTVTITEPSILNITATSTPSQCGKSNGSVSASALGGNGGYVYSWTTGANTQIVNNLSPATYTVTAIDSKGCTITTASTVGDTIFSIIIGNPATQSISEGNSVTLTVSGAATYTWTPAMGLSCTNCPNPIATPIVSTTYTVLATDIFNCTVTAMLTIIVKPPCIGEEADVFIANVFSPNNDGKNDLLYIQGDGLTNIYWAMYDRWGNLLFEAFDQMHPWDGTKKNNPMESGVYVYYLKATCIKTNTEVKLKGNVSIVK